LLLDLRQSRQVSRLDPKNEFSYAEQYEYWPVVNGVPIPSLRAFRSGSHTVDVEQGVDNESEALAVPNMQVLKAYRRLSLTHY